MLIHLGRDKLLKFLGTVMTIGVSCAALTIGSSGTLLMRYQTPTPADSSAVDDIREQRGPFAIGDQNYTVLMHFKHLSKAGTPRFAQTLSALEIRDATGTPAYEKNFPYALAEGRFQQSVSASVERFEGKTGAGLMVRYVQQAVAPQPGQGQTTESWQLLSLLNGKLAPLGKPATIGEPNAGGPYMGVIMRAANGAVSVISQPDTIEVRAWAGSFYVFIPLRVDWSKGGLAQGQRCVERLAGPLQDVGCPMRVEASRKPPVEEFSFLRLFTKAHENFGNPEHVVLQENSNVEILGCSAITTWNENDGLIQQVFSDVWLHVRIGGRDGWIHGEEDLAAVGLPAGSPVP